MNKMNLSIEVFNLTRKKIEVGFVKKVVRKTLKLTELCPRLLEISVVFIGENEIQKLNQIYRRKNISTDVLSFNYSSGYNKKGVQGELFLCPLVIARSAKENRVSFKKEVAFVLAHGILHLLGMKHGRRMYELQDKIALQSTK